MRDPPLVVVLPAPCAGVRYSERVAVGEAGRLEATSIPPGFSFDPVTATVSGSPGAMGGGVMELALISSAGVRRAVTVDLTLRRDCWFAYLGGTAAGSVALHFRDAFLRNDVVLPASGATVRDFQFSPDGAWLVFRAGPPDRLELYSYSTTLPLASDAERIEFACSAGPAGSCSVLDYAWSEDSRHLAVALSGPTPQQDYLAGVDVSGDVLRPWPLLGEAVWVTSNVPLDFRGQLVWAGSSAVGLLGADFGSPDPASSDALYSAAYISGGELGSLGALRGISSALVPAGAKLRSIPSGMAIIHPVDAPGFVVVHRRPAEADVQLSSRAGALSPSGRWIAHTVGGADGGIGARLSVVSTAGDDAEIALETEPGTCADVIAWSSPIRSSDVELIACRHDHAVTIFELWGAPGRRELRRVSELTFPGDIRGTRRGFSSSGRSLVLGDTESSVFSIFDVSGPSATSIEPALGFVPPAELEFSPTLDVVALGTAAAVIEYPLPGGSARGRSPSSEPSAPRSACSEAFWAASERWCGAPRVPGHFVYSPGSSSMLLEPAPGVLRLFQAATAAEPTVTSALPACGTACDVPPYAFKP